MVWYGMVGYGMVKAQDSLGSSKLTKHLPMVDGMDPRGSITNSKESIINSEDDTGRVSLPPSPLHA